MSFFIICINYVKLELFSPLFGQYSFPDSTMFDLFLERLSKPLPLDATRRLFDLGFFRRYALAIFLMLPRLMAAGLDNSFALAISFVRWHAVGYWPFLFFLQTFLSSLFGFPPSHLLRLLFAFWERSSFELCQ